MSEITDKLLTYPDAIKTAELAVLMASETYVANHAQVKELDAGFAAIVNNNPAFKNQGQRDTEIKAMKEESSEYTDALIEEETAAKNLAVAEIDVHYLHNMFKAHLAIVGGQSK